MRLVGRGEGRGSGRGGGGRPSGSGWGGGAGGSGPLWWGGGGSARVEEGGEGRVSASGAVRGWGGSAPRLDCGGGCWLSGRGRGFVAVCWVGGRGRGFGAAFDLRGRDCVIGAAFGLRGRDCVVGAAGARPCVGNIYHRSGFGGPALCLTPGFVWNYLAGAFGIHSIRMSMTCSAVFGPPAGRSRSLPFVVSCGELWRVFYIYCEGFCSLRE